MLLTIADPDARRGSDARVFGRPAWRWLSDRAAEAGFERVITAAGTPEDVGTLETVGSGDPIGAPTCVLFEASVVHAEQLAQWVEATATEPGASLYDDGGRPIGWVTRHLESCPAVMPVGESLGGCVQAPLGSAVRIVDDQDLRRAEHVIFGDLLGRSIPPGSWVALAGVPTLRWLCHLRAPPFRVEVALFGLSIGVALLCAFKLTMIVGLALAVGLVHVARWVEPAHVLRDSRLASRAGAIRSLVHAAAVVGLSRAVLSEGEVFVVADLAVFTLGASAAALCLLSARNRLLGRVSDPLELPDLGAWARKIGLRGTESLAGLPVLEAFALLTAFGGDPVLPWLVELAGAGGRLWRWFAGPPRSRRAEPPGPPGPADASASLLEGTQA